MKKMKNGDEFEVDGKRYRLVDGQPCLVLEENQLDRIERKLDDLEKKVDRKELIPIPYPQPYPVYPRPYYPYPYFWEYRNPTYIGDFPNWSFTDGTANISQSNSVDWAEVKDYTSAGLLND